MFALSADFKLELTRACAQRDKGANHYFSLQLSFEYCVPEPRRTLIVVKPRPHKALAACLFFQWRALILFSHSQSAYLLKGTTTNFHLLPATVITEDGHS